ncbi:ATP-dependent translocase ABCB1 [Lamellibrachia satsuma]|nr:ATP-dependent translocase ABCB1 [Lamellibrachia satsuma]
MKRKVSYFVRVKKLVCGQSDHASVIFGVKDEADVDDVRDGQLGTVNDTSNLMVNALGMFRFADGLDKILMLTGTLCSCLEGAAMPLMMFLFGNMADIFIDDSTVRRRLEQVSNIGQNGSHSNTYSSADINWTNGSRDIIPDDVPDLSILPKMRQCAIYYTFIGTGVLALNYVQTVSWRISSHRQARRIRVRLFRSILNKDIAWFDTHNAGEMNTRLSDDINRIQEGISENLGRFISGLCAFVSGYVAGFVYGWQLTVVLAAVSPLLVLSGTFISKVRLLEEVGATLTRMELKAYAKAGAVAEETISCIRTVTAFGGQEKEYCRYTSHLSRARRMGITKGLVNGGSEGFVTFVLFALYALAFWYGAQLVAADPAVYTGGRIIAVLYCVMTGAFSLGSAAPNMQAFSAARGAAAAIFDIIDQTSVIHRTHENIKPKIISGNIELRDITFKYPSRPKVQSSLHGFDQLTSSCLRTFEHKLDFELASFRSNKKKKQLSNVNITATQMSSLDPGLPKLSGTVDYLDNQSRRSNLRVDGIAEIPEILAQVEEDVRTKLAKELNTPEEASRTSQLKGSTVFVVVALLRQEQ